MLFYNSDTTQKSKAKFVQSSYSGEQEMRRNHRRLLYPLNLCRMHQNAYIYSIDKNVAQIVLKGDLTKENRSQ